MNPARRKVLNPHLNVCSFYTLDIFLVHFLCPPPPEIKGYEQCSSQYFSLPSNLQAFYYYFFGGGFNVQLKEGLFLLLLSLFSLATVSNLIFLNAGFPIHVLPEQTFQFSRIPILKPMLPQKELFS